MDDKKPNINLSAEVAEGTYANLALITHSLSEFVVDFIRVMPNVQNPTVKARIILTPEHAKRLLRALNENIEGYEAEFGTIQIKRSAPSGNYNGGPKGEA